MPPNDGVVHNRGVQAEIHDPSKSKDVSVDTTKTETTKTTEQAPPVEKTVETKTVEKQD